MQLNNAKFEFNGNTGYILKPWALRSERAQFSPFVIKKLEDIVPAKISIKVYKIFYCLKKHKRVDSLQKTCQKWDSNPRLQL